MIPYNMGQKINCMKNVTFAKDPLHYLIVFLEDGSVMELKVDNKKEETLSVADMIEQKKVSKFPTATKSASISKAPINFGYPGFYYTTRREELYHCPGS